MLVLIFYSVSPGGSRTPIAIISDSTRGFATKTGLIWICLFFKTRLVCFLSQSFPCKINPCGRFRNDGYEFMWVINDVWSQLAMNIAWPRWHGKNLSALGELGARWEIAETHIVRSSAYKGENQVACLPGFRYDALTTLGLFPDAWGFSSSSGPSRNHQVEDCGANFVRFWSTASGPTA